jgi:hypothetical protein
MNDTLLVSLIQILQKHASAIRKLTELNISLGDLLRESEERAGVSYEEFEKRLRASLAAVGGAGPFHDWHRGVAKEIEETIDELHSLEKLVKKPLN